MSKNSPKMRIECLKAALSVQKKEMVEYNKRRKEGVRPSKKR